MSSLPYPPANLAHDCLEDVRVRMIGCEADLFAPPDVCKITDAMERRHTPANVIQGRHANADRSFARQMARVHDDPASIFGVQTAAPDAYVMTARSAIPVADAVRGYYDALGETLPYLTYIAANRRLAADYFDYSPSSTIAFEAEVRRLEVLLSGMGHVCVIDQFTSTGRTLLYAGAILSAVGVSSVSAIRGTWYQNYPKGDPLDTEGVTCRFANFMHETGVLSVQQLQQQRLVAP